MIAMARPPDPSASKIVPEWGSAPENASRPGHSYPGFQSGPRPESPPGIHEIEFEPDVPELEPDPGIHELEPEPSTTLVLIGLTGTSGRLRIMFVVR